MPLKVFADLLSQPCRAVFLFCKVNNVNFTPCLIAMRKMEHLSDEYAKVNPFKRLPAIQDGDFTMTESSAILEYIASKYNCPSHWSPSDPQKKAKSQEFMAWHTTDLRPNTAGYFFNKVIYPNVKGEPADEKLINKQWKQSTKAFKAIENYFLKDRPFIAGEEISIADLLGVCEIVQVGSVDVDFAKDYPVMKAWIQRVRNETNPNFDEVHKILYRIGKITDPSKL